MKVGDASLGLAQERDAHSRSRFQARGRRRHVGEVFALHEIQQCGADAVEPHVGDRIRWFGQALELRGDDGRRLDDAFVSGLDPVVAGLEGALAIRARRKIRDAGLRAMRRENLLLLETVEEFSGDLADRIVVANVPFAGDDHAFVFLALRHVTGLSYTWSAPSR